MTRNEFRKIRLESGLTQNQLADLLEVSDSTVKRIEQGTRSPMPHKHAMKLLKAFGKKDSLRELEGAHRDFKKRFSKHFNKTTGDYYHMWLVEKALVLM